MEIKTIKEAGELKDKRVLVRVDWNTPLINGELRDDFRIKESLPTLEFLKQAGAKVIIATHLEPDHTSTDIFRRYVPEGMELLPNLRDNPGEKSNDEAFAKELAGRADVYVNEAFSVSHREHASIVGVPKFLPHFVGFQFMREVENLSKAFRPQHPFLFIVGGAKFDTKLPLLTKFVKLADNVFVGGALAHNFFQEQGRNIGKSLITRGEFNIKELLASGKILLPVDMVVNKSGENRTDLPDFIQDNDAIMDAGPDTITMLTKKINESKFILWNGPIGDYEKGYTQYTLELARILAGCDKETIVGGGDTLAAIKELNLDDKYSFVSTAGGAMLDFLANETLPGIEALKQ